MNTLRLRALMLHFPMRHFGAKTPGKFSPADIIRYEMRNLFVAVSFTLAVAAPSLLAQQKTSATNPSMALDTPTIPLWEGRAPGALGDEDRDKPTLTIYMPRNAPEGGATAVV